MVAFAPTMPALSVIVLNYNGERWLPRCLDALQAQRGAPPFEVIVADNASADGSVDLVRAKYPEIRLLEAGANLGFAAGNNAAAREARGEWLVFLNNDTAAEPDWLARLHDAARGHPTFTLFTSRIVFLDDPSIVDSAGDGYLRAGGAFKRGHGGPASAFGESGEVFGACGAALMIRRDVFAALRGFDERFFMVYEDVDLSYRARLLGHRCWYAADAIVHHAVNATLGTASAAAIFYGQRNLEWTWVKNTPRALLLATTPAHVVYSAMGVLHYARLGFGGAALKGKWDAWRRRREVLQDRRWIQGSRLLRLDQLEPLMERGWLAGKRREKRFTGRRSNPKR